MAVAEPRAMKRRPVYLNLAQIRLPLPGLLSILHRISGAASADDDRVELAHREAHAAPSGPQVTV